MKWFDFHPFASESIRILSLKNLWCHVRKQFWCKYSNLEETRLKNHLPRGLKIDFYNVWINFTSIENKFSLFEANRLSALLYKVIGDNVLFENTENTLTNVSILKTQYRKSSFIQSQHLKENSPFTFEYLIFSKREEKHFFNKMINAFFGTQPWNSTLGLLVFVWFYNADSIQCVLSFMFCYLVKLTRCSVRFYPVLNFLFTKIFIFIIH